MKYGPDRFNRNPRAAGAAATGDRAGAGERLNYCAAGFCAPWVLHSAILFILISLSDNTRHRRGRVRPAVRARPPLQPTQG